MAKLLTNLPSASWASRALYAKKSMKTHRGFSLILLVGATSPNPFDHKITFCGYAPTALIFKNQKLVPSLSGSAPALIHATVDVCFFVFVDLVNEPPEAVASAEGKAHLSNAGAGAQMYGR